MSSGGRAVLHRSPSRHECIVKLLAPERTFAVCTFRLRDQSLDVHSLPLTLLEVRQRVHELRARGPRSALHPPRECYREHGASASGRRVSSSTTLHQDCVSDAPGRPSGRSSGNRGLQRPIVLALSRDGVMINDSGDDRPAIFAFNFLALHFGFSWDSRFLRLTTIRLPLGSRS